jgi:DNA-binding response OmpR family regulator
MKVGRRRFGDVILDPRNGWVICGETRIDLPPAAARLLDALIGARGNSLTGEALRQAMRAPGHPEVSVENLRVSMVSLRRALAKAGSVTKVANRIGYGWRLDYVSVAASSPHSMRMRTCSPKLVSPASASLRMLSKTSGSR